MNPDAISAKTIIKTIAAPHSFAGETASGGAGGDAGSVAAAAPS